MSSSLHIPDEISSIVGRLYEWEREILPMNEFDRDGEVVSTSSLSPPCLPPPPPDNSLLFSTVCLFICEKQKSIHRGVQWAKLAAINPPTFKFNLEAHLLLYSLTYLLPTSLDYEREEALFKIGQLPPRVVKRWSHSLYFDSKDQGGSAGVRYRVRALVSGSLRRNKDTPIYRSFFHSPLREVLVLPLIAEYLTPKTLQKKGKKIWKSRPKGKCPQIVDISSLKEICAVLFEDVSSLEAIRVAVDSDHKLISFLSLILSRCFVKKIYIYYPYLQLSRLRRECKESLPVIDLSFLVGTNTSSLSELFVENCHVLSLSPLSECDLSSLQVLKVHETTEARFNRGLTTLEGLNKDNTASLQTLEIHCPHIKDISVLSTCDLSSLVKLSFSSSSVSSLSSLVDCDFSNLKELSLSQTKISDISPLTTWKGFAPFRLSFTAAPIEDISPLSLLDLSLIIETIDLSRTNVADLSPLESITVDDLRVSLTNTPVASKAPGRDEIGDQYSLAGKVKIYLFGCTE